MNRRKRLTFWHANKDDDRLVRSVISGKKTATATPASEYYDSYGEYGDGGLEVDDVVEVYDPKQVLRCLIKITDVHLIKFGAIPERVWKGETFSSAEEFRECHRRCNPDVEFHGDYEYMITHFELVEVI